MISLNLLEYYLGLTIGFCAALILLFVALSFIIFSGQKEKKKKFSLVDTTTMLIFVLILTVVIRKHIGDLIFRNYAFNFILMIIGAILVIFGAFFNIYGRYYLGKNWSNQIRIYKTQKLIMTGAYGLVRHPLYASLIWLFFGVSLIYRNYLSLLLNIVIFMPMMYIRVKQEEKLLEKSFVEYKEYKEKIGMFFPKLKKFKDYFERNTITASNKLIVALILYFSYFLKTPELALIGALIAIFPLIMTFTNYEKIKYCQNRITRLIKMQFASEVCKNDLGEIRFSLVFGLSILILGIIHVYFGNSVLGYRLILAIAIFKTVSGLGFCAGIYLYNLLKYCPICRFKKAITEEIGK